MNAGASTYAGPSPIKGSGTAWVLLGSWALSPARPTPIHPRRERRGFSALLVITSEDNDWGTQLATASAGKALSRAIDCVAGRTGATVARHLAPGGRMLVYGALSSHRQTDPAAFEMPLFAPRLIYSAVAVQGWYLLHWLEVTPLADCGAIFAKVLDRLASGALRLPPAKRYRPQKIADALRDADGTPREGKLLLDLSSWAADERIVL